MTNIFISWSGDKSRRIAEELHKWIPSVLQFSKPYFTPSDIEKGAKWGNEISKKLSETDVGIICLTKENVERPWILFEAGALSKDLEKSRVCSVLFGIENTDLAGPLTTFQTTGFSKSDFRKLMQTINDAGGDRALSRDTFDNVFNMWWPRLEDAITAILVAGDPSPETEVRDDREILEEILSLARLNARTVNIREVNRFPIPPGWVGTFLAAIEDTVDIYDAQDDKSLHGVIKQLIDLAEYLISKNEKLYEEFATQVGNIRNRFDSIIPF